MSEISVETGKRIRYFRANRGMTLEELAAAVYKSKATISKYEKGDMDIIFKADSKAEEIFKYLIEQNYSPAAYNLAVYYKKRGNDNDAAKYFKLAETMKLK